jgi:hypothetical protein
MAAGSGFRWRIKRGLQGMSRGSHAGVHAAESIANSSNVRPYRDGHAYQLGLDDLGGARESLRRARAAQEPDAEAAVFQHFAHLVAMRGELQISGRLIGFVDGLYAEYGLQREQAEQWSFERVMALLNERMSETEIAALAEDGRVWSEDRAVDEALTL